MNRDRIYSLPRQRVGEFTFDDSVADVFPDMIARSVPGYASILSMIEQLAGRFIRPGTNIYDLGCSLGAATWLIRPQASMDCTLHAVDNSPAMIARLQQRLAELSPQEIASGCAVETHQADICQVSLDRASFVVLNFTLQFIPSVDREPLLQKICESLIPGGALLLSEKISFEDDSQQALLSELHHDFKRAHGYSDLEIAQKRTSIENMLIPEPLDAHLSRLQRVGFEVVAPWFQCFNFASILAIKN